MIFSCHVKHVNRKKIFELTLKYMFISIIYHIISFNIFFLMKMKKYNMYIILDIQSIIEL